MQLNSFINKVVISSKSGKRYLIQEINASYITVKTEKPNELGYCPCYLWETINGDPIKNGDLVFEDKSLTEPFCEAYEAYSHTEDARWESYGYWMMKSY